MIIETIISTMSREKKPQTSPFGIKKKKQISFDLTISSIHDTYKYVRK